MKVRLSFAERRKLVSQFVKDITERPYDFVLRPYTLDDTVSGREWWIANGLIFFELRRPQMLSVGFLNRFRCWYHFTKWLRKFKAAQADDMRFPLA